jgi:hypothetical protein
MIGVVEAAKRATSVITIAALLAGCATAAQRQYQSIRNNDQAAGQEYRACMEAVYDSPEFEPLRRHIPYKITDVTLEQLSDNSLATDDQIRLILEAHPKKQSCRKQALDHLAQFAPTVVPIALSGFTKNEDNLIDLIQKKQSWGAYVRRGRDIGIAEQAEMQAEARRITSELQQSHEAELAQRQAAAQSAAAALAQYAQTQQIINNMNRPTFTNCLRIGPQGSMLNCTTY